MRKIKLVLILFGLVLFSSFGLSQNNNDLKNSFTAIGNQINCEVAKFLLEDNEKNIDGLDCVGCAYNYAGTKENDLRFRLEKIRLSKNIEIAKKIENEKKIIRKEGVTRDDISEQIDKLISYSLNLVRELQNKDRDIDSLHGILSTLKEDALSKLKIIPSTQQLAPEETEPIETVTEETEPIETVTEETEPIETVTEETEPVETVTEETEPVETVTEETEPVEATGTDTRDLPPVGTPGTNNSEASISLLFQILIFLNLLLVILCIVYVISMLKIFKQNYITKKMLDASFKDLENKLNHTQKMTSTDSAYQQPQMDPTVMRQFEEILNREYLYITSKLKSEYSKLGSLVDEVLKKEKLQIKSKLKIEIVSKKLDDRQIENFIKKELDNRKVVFKSEFNNYVSKSDAVTLFNTQNIVGMLISTFERKNVSSNEIETIVINRFSQLNQQLFSSSTYIKKKDLLIEKDKLISKIKAEIEELANQSIIYYMPFPDKDGFFWDDKKNKTKGDFSAYRLSVNRNNPDVASYKLLDEKTMVNSAIQGYDIKLQPICEIDFADRSGKRISQVGADGELYKEGKKWKVSPGKKLQIRIHN